MHPFLRTTAFLACAVGLLGLASCSNPSGVSAPVRPPSSVVGCYSLSIGKWSHPRESLDPPGTIVLLDSIGTYLLESGKPLVRRHPAGSSMPFDMAWWDRISSEHLDLVFTEGGYIGVRLYLVWGWGDSAWRGTAAAFTDVAPSTQATATARLSPRSCD